MSAPSIAWDPALVTGDADVEAGTLLGVGRHGAADLVGDGAVAVLRPGGRVDVRAARDGVPALCPDGVVVGRRHERDAADGAVVRGALRVAGHVAPGRELSATGPLRVEGDVDRAELRAGGELQLEGRATGAHLSGGALAALRGRLHDPLRGMAADLDALVLVTANLLAAASARGHAPSAARALRALCDDRHAGLEPRLARAMAEVAAFRRAWPGGCEGLLAAIAGAHRAVAAPEAVADPVGDLIEAAGFLAAALPSRLAVAPVGARLRAATRCGIVTAGPLRLLGAGADDCDLDVGGDLIAMATGGGVRGGAVRVGGRVRARELASRPGALLRIRLDAAGTADDVVTADVVGPGVEIVAAGGTLRFDRRRTGVRVGLAGGRPVLAAAA
ncbi:MAG TPA: hypothetical protein VL422_10945 [Miltoncostaea sp.]|nr:hypothetical protein [Miltoncostaea sp.]